MYCAACNLRYPDHLNFCRRCGQGLVHSTSDPVMDSVCCTRCGARTARGENFCQQCGSRLATIGQETVVGACYHCGTSWRTGWLFCKTCGLDRDRALLLPTSWPTTPSSAERTLAAEVEDLPQVDKVYCKRCGAESKPYSRFCEACGNTLALSREAPPREPAVSDIEDAPITGKLVEPPVKKMFAASAEESPATKPQAYSLDRASRQTVFEPSGDPSRGGRKTVAFGESSATSNLTDIPEAVIVDLSAEARNETVVTAFPSSAPTGGGVAGDSSRLVQKSDSVGAWVVWIIIVALALAAGFVAWRLFRSQKQPRPSVPSLTREQPSPATQSSPDVAPSPAQSPEVPVAAPAGMVFVPGGTFRMGRDSGDEFESPAHSVSVEPFFIDRGEVTNEEYQRFVSAIGHRVPAHWVDGKLPEGQAKFPVVSVSWDDANAFAQWANKRLPTEAEWEFAARGTDNRLYPWGNVWKQEYANAGRQKDGGPLEVGRFVPGASPFGALDMCGNVWEWTASDYTDYPGRRTPSLLAGAGLKVIRGGAYDVAPKRATTTYRGAIPPDRTPDRTGFRCARGAQ